MKKFIALLSVLYIYSLFESNVRITSDELLIDDVNIGISVDKFINLIKEKEFKEVETNAKDGWKNISLRGNSIRTMLVNLLSLPLTHQIWQEQLLNFQV